MGECRYCGQDAGFLRGAHAPCKKLHEDGIQEIQRLAGLALRDDAHFGALNTFVQSRAGSHFINEAALKETLSGAWERAVEESVRDHVLDSQEERRLMQFVSGFRLDPARLNKNGAYTRASMALVLSDVMTKGFSTRVSFEGGVPFLLKANEKLVFRFRDTPLFEEKIVREYQGRSQGMSFRVMRGVYYRVGGSRGRAVEHSEIQQVDTGQLGVTDRALYFAGTRGSFRITYDKILSVQPYSDAVAIAGDGANAKTKIFKTQEGWFLYNLITALASRQP